MQQALAPEVGHRSSGWDRLRLSLFGVWLLLLLTTFAVGHRETPLHVLETAVADGRVDSVVVVGAAPSGQGWSTQVVRWQDGLVRRTTQASVGSPADGVGVGVGQPARDEDLGVLLSRADPGLDVRRSEQGSGAPYGQLLGWQVPTWVALTGLVAVLVQLAYLVNVPTTWRATRWAWFWIMAVPLVGTALLLLLSGRTPGLPPPRAPERRLTGGWAFLFSSAATTFLSGATMTLGL